MIKLVATDLDGTLLRDDKTVNAWTRSVLDAAEAQGILVVPVTARQPRGLHHIAEAAGLTGWSICVNGALVRHLTTGEVLFERLVEPDAMQALAGWLDAELPRVRFAAVQDGGSRFAVGPGYRELAHPDDHQPAMLQAVGLSRDELLATPALKLLARHAELSAVELSRRIADSPVPGIHATTSGADFVEIAAAGVTKATGLAQLCAGLGIDRSEVAAFGDAPNDVEMLGWAGHSWAMANAVDEVKSVATHRTTSNMDDGVARALMRVLRDPSAW